VVIGSRESPSGPGNILFPRLLDAQIHWMMTYRSNADIYFPYGMVIPRDEGEQISELWQKNIAKTLLRNKDELESGTSSIREAQISLRDANSARKLRGRRSLGSFSLHDG